MSCDEITINNNNEIIIVCKQDSILKILKFLKKHESCKFTSLVDIMGVHFPEMKTKQYEINYQLDSKLYNQRIRLKTYVSQYKPIINSISSVYLNSSWHECELWDMLGIWISNLSNLRKILTDYGFNKHPLKKNFPLSGYYDLIYDDYTKSVVKTPLEFSQEFRIY